MRLLPGGTRVALRGKPSALPADLDMWITPEPERPDPNLPLGEAARGQCDRIWLRNRRVRSDCGLLKKVSGGAASMISPASMNSTRLATWRAKPISWVTHNMVIAGFREVDHHVEHLGDHFGVKGRSGFVEEHDVRLHAQRAGNRHALLLTTGELSRKLAGLLGDSHPFQVLHGRLFRFALRTPAYPHGRQGAILQYRQMGKQVEVLEHHAHFTPYGIDVLEIVRQLHAVNHQTTALVFLQTVNAANQGGFAGAGRPADDHPLAAPPRPD